MPAIDAFLRQDMDDATPAAETWAAPWTELVDDEHASTTPACGLRPACAACASGTAGIGLTTALTEEREAAAKLADLQQLLASLPGCRRPATSAAYQGRQHTIEMVRDAAADTRATLDDPPALAAAAREHWRLRPQPSRRRRTLLERRAASRTRRARARETRELDEVARRVAAPYPLAIARRRYA